jgi:membrane protein DedA with SNARE-associated domain
VRVFDTAALYVYVGTFVALVAAGVGFPIPEELPIVTAGAMAGHAAEPPAVEPELMAAFMVTPDAPFPANLPWAAFVEQAEHPELWEAQHYHRLPLKWWLLLPICILGVVISDALLYGMGRFWGPKLLETRWMKRILAHDKRQKIEANFQKYGVLVLLFARFLPSIRSPIFIMAGVTKVSFARFVVADGIYAIPGVSLLFFLAFWFGDRVRELVERAEGRLKTVVILAALTAVAAYLLYHLFRHPVATGDPNVEMPLIGPQIVSHVLRAPDTQTMPSGDHDSEAKPPSTDAAAERDHPASERGT